MRSYRYVVVGARRLRCVRRGVKRRPAADRPLGVARAQVLDADAARRRLA